MRLSFFTYPCPLLKPLVHEPYLSLASIEDITCMKLSAITGRATEKDYVDLFFVLKTHTLPELLSYSRQKHPTLDTNLVLKSLVYFDDVVPEPIRFTDTHAVSFTEVSAALAAAVAKVA